MFVHSNFLFLIFLETLVSNVFASFDGHPIYRHLARKSRPRNEGDRPIDVAVGFYVESIGNFRSTEMTFDMDMYLYLSWRDERLRHNETGHVLINDKKVLDKIWLPDLYFANARTAYFHEVTVHNFNLFVAQDGLISYGTRVTLNLACHLALQNYPLDRQTCLVKIISYAHVKDEVNATWFPTEPIRYNPEIALPEYHILSLEPGYCDGVFHYTITPNSSRIGIVRASYIPTALIVAISWVSFWIDRRAVPARVSLSFTTLLTLSTQGNGIRYTLPPVSYAKAIDYFYGVCMLFIFGVLLEFTLVNSYMRKANKYNQMAERLQGHGPSKPPSYVSDMTSDCDTRNDSYIGCYMNKSAAHLMYKAVTYSRKALWIDKTSRYAFPLTFTIFNVFYWMYYLREPEEALF